jgi:hypothetical protein
MSYYQGDYYRGGFFGTIFKGIKGLAGGLLGLGGGGGGQKQQQGPANPFGNGMSSLGPIAQQVIRGGKQVLTKHPVLSAAAAAGALAVAGGGAMAMRGSHPALAAAGGVMRGYHISKKTGAMVKNRHMHVTNPRALRRAIRRTHGFAKLAMKVIKIHHPQKKGRFGGYRRRKKK